MTDTAKLMRRFLDFIETFGRPVTIPNGLRFSTTDKGYEVVIPAQDIDELRAALTAYTANQGTPDEETVERMADRFDHALNVALVAEALLKGFWFSDEKQAVRAARAALSAIPARDEALEGLRPEVLAFARLMETKLRANDHKPGWKSDRAADLWRRLSADETYELYEAITADAPDPKHVGSEAADIANFAMMIADVCGALSDETVRAKLAAPARGEG